MESTLELLPHTVPSGIVEIPFETSDEHCRRPDSFMDSSDPDVVRVNNEFPIWFLIPPNTPVTDVAIVVNGFAEGKHDLYFDEVYGIAPLLAQHGIATAFLPLPFHLHRIPDYERYIKVARMRGDWGFVPVFLCGRRQERIYLGYRQVISDIAKLTREMLDRDREEYKRWFHPALQVHLLGYSLGGLACFATLLKRAILVQKRDIPENARRSRFASCTLLSSGASFLDLQPWKELGIKEASWDGIREYYFKREFADPVALERIEDEGRLTDLRDIKYSKSVSYDVFSRVILGLPSTTVDPSIVLDSTFAVLGNADEVVPHATVLRIARDKRVFPVLEVPALRHVFHDTTAWKTAAPWAVSSIAAFMRSKGSAGAPATRAGVVGA